MPTGGRWKQGRAASESRRRLARVGEQPGEAEEGEADPREGDGEADVTEPVAPSQSPPMFFMLLRGQARGRISWPCKFRAEQVRWRLNSIVYSVAGKKWEHMQSGPRRCKRLRYHFAQLFVQAGREAGFSGVWGRSRVRRGGCPLPHPRTLDKHALRSHECKKRQFASSKSSQILYRRHFMELEKVIPLYVLHYVAFPCDRPSELVRTQRPQNFP